MADKKRKTNFYRLTIDLEKGVFSRLKELADQENRTASKQAKVILTEALNAPE